MNRSAFILCQLTICNLILGAMTMSFPEGVFAKTFKLKGPQEYFINEKDQQLLAAAMGGDLTKAQQLVTQGANPNEEGPPSNKYNRLRLLHYAIAANNQRAVKILMMVGADPELVAIGYGGAFDFAMTLDDAKMLSFMFDLRPIMSLKKDSVDDLLAEAVIKKRQRCLELFIQRGAPIDQQDSAGYTIMMRAIDTHNYELAEWLILKGASVYIVAKSGMTPAYSIEYDLRKYKPGSPPYKKVQHLMKLMEERGAKFPATNPVDIREGRAKPPMP